MEGPIFIKAVGEFFNLAMATGGPIITIAMIAGIKTLMTIAKELKQASKSIETSVAELKKDSQAILRDMLLERGDLFLDRGWLSLEDAQNYSALFERYKAEGGNWFIDELMDKVKELPIKDK